MLDNAERQKAKELLIKSKVYRFFAICFAFVGLLVFIYLYIKHVEGDIVKALSSPFTVVIFVFPFLPAIVFSWISVRAQDKFIKMVHKTDQKKTTTKEK